MGLYDRDYMRRDASGGDDDGTGGNRRRTLVMVGLALLIAGVILSMVW